MRASFRLTLTELKLIVSDKTFYVWAFLLPLLFMFIFGSMKYSEERKKVDLYLLTQEKTPLVEKFASALEEGGLTVRLVQQRPSGKVNLLVLPEDFSEALEKGKKVELELHLSGGQLEKKSFFLRFSIYRATAVLLAEKLAGQIKRYISHKSQWYSREKYIPHGFNFYVSAVIVMFILFNVLLYNGQALWRFRERGLIERFAVSPLGKGGLWLSFFMLGFMLGLLATGVLLASARILFKADFGPHPLVAIGLLALYTAAISNLGVLMASVIKKREVIIGLSVLTANLLSALGGCWWPLEIVPDFMRKIASFLPTTWTISGLNKLIFFQLPPSSVLPNAGLLSLFLLITTLLSIRFFKLR